MQADEATYNSDTRKRPQPDTRARRRSNDDHIRASHATYNLALETGRFYDVTAHRAALRANRVSSFDRSLRVTGRIVDKTSPDHYLVYDGTITTCELLTQVAIRRAQVIVDVGGNAKIYRSTFLLHGLPILYFPSQPTRWIRIRRRVPDAVGGSILHQRQCHWRCLLLASIA